MKILKISLTYIVLIILVSSISAQSTLNDYFNKVVPELIEKKRDREYKEQLLEIEREKLELERQQLKYEKLKYEQRQREIEHMKSQNARYKNNKKIQYSRPLAETRKNAYLITPNSNDRDNAITYLGLHNTRSTSMKEADQAFVIMRGQVTSPLKDSYKTIFIMEENSINYNIPNGNYAHIYIYKINSDMSVKQIDYITGKYNE